MSAFKDLVTSFIISILNGYDANVNTAVSLLSSDLFSGSLFDIVLSISQIIIPFGVEIAQILLFFSLYEKIFDLRNPPIMAFLKSFLWFLFAKMAINSSVEILSYIYYKVADLIQQIGTTNSTIGATVGVLIESKIADMKFFEMLGLISTSVILLIVILLVGFVVQAIAYGRVFEILLYVGVSPIPLAFIAEENGRVARNFILRFLAVCLQGVLMLISFKLYSAIVATTFMSNLQSTSNIFSLLYTMVLSSLVLVMAIVKSGSYGSKILDV
jgi:hypothetical protein